MVRGLVTPPKSGRASRSMQHFFVNGRFVKNRTMMAALEAAYKGVLMQGRFPGCVLTLTMPAQLVDVNVHPAKTEVRFAREKEIFDVVYAAVKSVLITPESSSKTLTFEQKKTQTTLPISPDVYKRQLQYHHGKFVRDRCIGRFTAYKSGLFFLSIS